MIINMNGYVKIKLLPKGLEIMRDQGLRPTDLEEDENGFVKFQLWEVMNTFGAHCFQGCELPFETDIIPQGLF